MTTPLGLKYNHGVSRCPYCQKVWLQLEEKEIPYMIEKINMRCYGSKPLDYMAIVSQTQPILL